MPDAGYYELAQALLSTPSEIAPALVRPFRAWAGYFLRGQVDLG